MAPKLLLYIMTSKDSESYLEISNILDEFSDIEFCRKVASIPVARFAYKKPVLYNVTNHYAVTSINVSRN